jgi:hypothetical protein
MVESMLEKYLEKCYPPARWYAMEIGMTRPYPDALALEYKRDYGTARRNLNVADIVNDPTANGECSVFGLSLPKQGFGLLCGDSCSLLKDLADTLLIAQE